MKDLAYRSILAAMLVLLLPAPGQAQAGAGGAGRVANGGGRPIAPEAEARPGDRVVLKIWNEPEMSDTFTVAQNGSVILPRLGSVPVQGVPIVELEDSLRRAYTAYLRNPSVEVAVLRRISVLGEVRNPGVYLADLTMGLPEVIARAGGPTENANMGRITVVRGSERFRFRGNRQEAMFAAQLLSGDQVIVERRNFLARNALATISTAVTVIALMVQLAR
jgi:polysaccharide biosynthesis/export protein